MSCINSQIKCFVKQNFAAIAVTSFELFVSNSSKHLELFPLNFLFKTVHARSDLKENVWKQQFSTQFLSWI